MRPRTLLLLFLLALPALLLATFPLRLGLELAGAERLGLAARVASGSLWRGRLHEARLHGVALGDASVRLGFWPLLAGTRALAVETPALRGRILQGRRQGLDGLDGGLSAEDVPFLPGLQLVARADGLRTLFAGDTCREAGGRLAIAVQRPGDAAPLAELEGAPACAGRTVELPLGARGGQGPLSRLQAHLRLHGDGQWELEARVPVVDDPAGRLLLEAAGFQPGPGGWSRVERGALR